MSVSTSTNISKYYAQRYSLFSRFDEGCVLDKEGWYSVTPEAIAAHIAKRFKGMDTVVDLFCGPGGNCIQFALHHATNVIGVDINADQLDMFRQNATVYGVHEKMEYIHGDAYNVGPQLARSRSVDAIFMSPPWGGPEYQRQKCFDVSIFKAPVELALSITKNVCILVPRNVNHQNVYDTFGVECEIEDNYVGNKIKTRSIYFGDLRTGKDNVSHVATNRDGAVKIGKTVKKVKAWKRVTGSSPHEHEPRRQGGQAAARVSKNVDGWTGERSFPRVAQVDVAPKPQNVNYREMAKSKGRTLQGGSFQTSSFTQMHQDRNTGGTKDALDSLSELNDALPNNKPQQPAFENVGQRNWSRAGPFAHGQFAGSTKSQTYRHFANRGMQHQRCGRDQELKSANNAQDVRNHGTLNHRAGNNGNDVVSNDTAFGKTKNYESETQSQRPTRCNGLHQQQEVEGESSRPNTNSKIESLVKQKPPTSSHGPDQIASPQSGSYNRQKPRPYNRWYPYDDRSEELNSALPKAGNNNGQSRQNQLATIHCQTTSRSKAWNSNSTQHVGAQSRTTSHNEVLKEWNMRNSNPPQHTVTRGRRYNDKQNEWNTGRRSQPEQHDIHTQRYNNSGNYGSGNRQDVFGTGRQNDVHNCRLDRSAWNRSDQSWLSTSDGHPQHPFDHNKSAMHRNIHMSFANDHGNTSRKGARKNQNYASGMENDGTQAYNLSRDNLSRDTHRNNTYMTGAHGQQYGAAHTRTMMRRTRGEWRQV